MANSNGFLKIFIGAFFLSLLAGCGDGSGSKTSNPDDAVYEIGLDVAQPEKLTPGKRQIWESIGEKKLARFSSISALLVDEHVKAFKSRSRTPITLSSVESILESFGKEFRHRMALAKPEEKDRLHKIHRILKLSLEEPKYLGGSFVYNKDAVTIADAIAEKKLQRYSGTLLYLLVHRKLGLPTEYRNANPVVILEPGHILPGIVESTPAGFELYGIEMVNSGPSLIKYGLTKDIQRELMVADADYFALIELFKEDIRNAAQVANLTIENTHKKYGIPLDLIQKAYARGYGEGGKRNMNSTPFGFGDVAIDPGDRPREPREMGAP